MKRGGGNLIKLSYWADDWWIFDWIIWADEAGWWGCGEIWRVAERSQFERNGRVFSSLRRGRRGSRFAFVCDHRCIRSSTITDVISCCMLGVPPCVCMAPPLFVWGTVHAMADATVCGCVCGGLDLLGWYTFINWILANLPAKCQRSAPHADLSMDLSPDLSHRRTRRPTTGVAGRPAHATF